MPDTSLQLERIASVPAHIWKRLESAYRSTLARAEKSVAKIVGRQIMYV